MNSFCAVCNGMSLKEVRLWDVSYFCEAGSIGPPPQSRDRKVSQQVSHKIVFNRYPFNVAEKEGMSVGF